YLIHCKQYLLTKPPVAHVAAMTAMPEHGHFNGQAGSFAEDRDFLMAHRVNGDALRNKRQEIRSCRDGDGGRRVVDGRHGSQGQLRLKFEASSRQELEGTAGILAWNLERS